jgi:hypothetical protein
MNWLRGLHCVSLPGWAIVCFTFLVIDGMAHGFSEMVGWLS